jgi:glycerol-3-phosphate acyltransferase PlsX
MKIGIDIMGGDYAPRETTLGAVEALRECTSEDTLVLLGDKDAILPILAEQNVSADRFQIVHAPEVIEMADNPTKAITQKPQSSIALGFSMLKSGELDAFSSAGNTGAMMVGAMFTVKVIPGIIRPSISSILPKEDGTFGLILDVGINADCKPEVLYQFGLLGSLFAQHVYHIPSPRVGLMNIGEEEEKGNLLMKETHQLMKGSRDFNFIGNVEGRDLFNMKSDVIVCDGFTGNVILKEAESFYTLLKKRGIKDDYFERFNYESYGGTPILGINSTVLIGHGISNAGTIKNMILLSRDIAHVKLSEKIAAALNKEPIAQ